MTTILLSIAVAILFICNIMLWMAIKNLAKACTTNAESIVVLSGSITQVSTNLTNHVLKNHQ